MGSPEIAGFELSSFSYDGRTYDFYRGGSGPALVVVHEVPGLHDGVIELARRFVREGYTVYMPTLFGKVGGEPNQRDSLLVILRLCVSREVAILADRTSPVVTWLRALAAKAHAESGGPGVGVIGMCLTGGFALAMAVEQAVLAPVMSQPALPAPVGARNRAALGLDREDLATIRRRTEQEGLCALGLRFTNDSGVPRERFETLRHELGDGFEGIEIDSSPGNAFGIPEKAHSVLTVDLVDEPGHPTREALDRVIEFLGERLR